MVTPLGRVIPDGESSVQLMVEDVQTVLRDGRGVLVASPVV